MKTCAKCRESKPVEAFNKNKSRKDGLESRCKACRAAYYKANSERLIAYHTKWYEANEGKRRAIEFRRRARAHGTLTEFTEVDETITLSGALDRFGSHCCYCGIETGYVEDGDWDYNHNNAATIEHLNFVARPGTSHTWDTIAIACRKCNSSRKPDALV